ncbi:hypothetical protein N7533_001810 [Penicillium manginii]|uniref:uncharacterized protein n=1 Tax=Penicillium manginii TaxID=203109 RepID=UPI002549BEBC|nr:uncharacterized protein N7533_001810 [Penicillium manginii]KAJ5763129.1 hypothetical protein N7533_001810 [Penicillium manginii]
MINLRARRFCQSAKSWSKTRRYLDMIMNYLDSTTEDMPSKISPEMKAAMRLSTHMLEQKYNEETKRFNKERSMCEI